MPRAGVLTNDVKFNRGGVYSLLAIKGGLKEEGVYLKHCGNDSFEASYSITPIVTF